MPATCKFYMQCEVKKIREQLQKEREERMKRLNIDPMECA